MRLKKRPVPENADEKKKTPEPSAGCGAVHGIVARLSAVRLALRHVESRKIVTTDALSENECDLLQPEGRPASLCLLAIIAQSGTAMLPHRE